MAAEEVFFVVGEGYEEAVGGFAVVGEVFADGGFGKMSPIAEESSASTYTFFRHSRRAQFYGFYFGKGDALCAERTVDI